MTSSDPKDGFDLIEYPCDFNFKAMCKAENHERSASDFIVGLITPLVDDEAILGVSEKSSRTGKFDSVTLTVRIQSREELESIYHLLSQADRVVMTL